MKYFTNIFTCNKLNDVCDGSSLAIRAAVTTSGLSDLLKDDGAGAQLFTQYVCYIQWLYILPWRSDVVIYGLIRESYVQYEYIFAGSSKSYYTYIYHGGFTSQRSLQIRSLFVMKWSFIFNRILYNKPGSSNIVCISSVKCV